MHTLMLWYVFVPLCPLYPSLVERRGSASSQRLLLLVLVPPLLEEEHPRLFLATTVEVPTRNLIAFLRTCTERSSRSCVAVLDSAAAQHPGDPAVHRLVVELMDHVAAEAVDIVVEAVVMVAAVVEVGVDPLGPLGRHHASREMFDSHRQ